MGREGSPLKRPSIRLLIVRSVPTQAVHLKVVAHSLSRDTDSLAQRGCLLSAKCGVEGRQWRVGDRERLVVMKGYMREGQPQLPGLEGTMFTRGSRKLCSLCSLVTLKGGSWLPIWAGSVTEPCLGMLRENPAHLHVAQK